MILRRRSIYSKAAILTIDRWSPSWSHRFHNSLMEFTPGNIFHLAIPAVAQDIPSIHITRSHEVHTIAHRSLVCTRNRTACLQLFRLGNVIELIFWRTCLHSCVSGLLPPSPFCSRMVGSLCLMLNLLQSTLCQTGANLCNVMTTGFRWAVPWASQACAEERFLSKEPHASCTVLQRSGNSRKKFVPTTRSL
jgi:hypothetical protein